MKRYRYVNGFLNADNPRREDRDYEWYSLILGKIPINHRVNELLLLLMRQKLGLAQLRRLGRSASIAAKAIVFCSEYKSRLIVRER
jgi:hypothetical protein